MEKFKNSWLDVNVLPSREELGKVAGSDIEKKIVDLLASKEEIRIIFAAAPSQNETLNYLVNSKKIDWSRVVAFNLDEYIGLASDAPQLFSSFLKERLFSKVMFKEVNLLKGDGNIGEEMKRYSELISSAPIDIVCLGIGENGHIAFNDPSVADFEDPLIVKQVRLDLESRIQQVNDGCFQRISDVPELALTLTIPTILKSEFLFCMVPGKSKKEAVFHTLNSPVTKEWPATVLQNHPNCKLYLDMDSFSFDPIKQM